MASALHSSTSTFAGVSFSPSFRSQQTSQPRKRLPSIKASATSPDPAALVSRRAGLLGVLGVAATLLPGSSAHAECSLATSPSGVAFCDLTVGTGPAAVSGTLVKAHYIGRLRATGETFDASYGGRPLVFKIGAGQVIQGWDIGVLGEGDMPPMRAGGKRTLVIPAALGYGARGAGCKSPGNCIIPPGAELEFTVEYLGTAY